MTLNVLPMVNTSTSSSGEIIPMLSLSNEAAGIALLKQVFGFEEEGFSREFGTSLVLGNQRVKVIPSLEIIGNVGLHHVAISVPNVDNAMTECLARGGTLAKSMTPNGPLEISEFWTNGVRYVFFEGPEGSLIELCMKNARPEHQNWGHDHVGILCHDILEIRRKFETIGCKEIAKHALNRKDGTTNVSFLKRGSSIIELFSPPSSGAEHEHLVSGRWIGCLV